MRTRARWLTRLLALAAAVFVPVVPAHAQATSGDEREVVAVVQKLFDAMASCDEPAIRAITAPEGRFYRVTVGNDTPAPSVTLDEFATSIGKCGRKMLERMWSPQVRVHKGIAHVWTPYDFWLNGAFSHCGIDSFELVRMPKGWILAGGTYTMEREGCAPSPLGTPK